MRPYYYPGFGIWDPREPDTTGRDPARPIRLQAVSSYPPLPATFRELFEDRARGEAVIRSLVTLTDVARDTAVGYTVGAPFVTSSTTAQERLELVPTEPLARGADRAGNHGVPNRRIARRAGVRRAREASSALMHSKATIAIACVSADGLAGGVSGHFGHAPFFAVAELAEGKVASSRVVASPGHGPGCSMPAFVAELGVGAVLVGGIGPGAINGLGARGIEVVAGVAGNAGAAAEAFAKGTLITGEPACHGGHGQGHDHDHGPGRGCGHHHH